MNQAGLETLTKKVSKLDMEKINFIFDAIEKEKNVKIDIIPIVKDVIDNRKGLIKEVNKILNKISGVQNEQIKKN